MQEQQSTVSGSEDWYVLLASGFVHVRKHASVVFAACAAHALDGTCLSTSGHNSVVGGEDIVSA